MPRRLTWLYQGHPIVSKSFPPSVVSSWHVDYHTTAVEEPEVVAEPVQPPPPTITHSSDIVPSDALLGDTVGDATQQFTPHPLADLHPPAAAPSPTKQKLEPAPSRWSDGRFDDALPLPASRLPPLALPYVHELHVRCPATVVTATQAQISGGDDAMIDLTAVQVAVTPNVNSSGQISLNISVDDDTEELQKSQPADTAANTEHSPVDSDASTAAAAYYNHQITRARLHRQHQQGLNIQRQRIQAADKLQRVWLNQTLKTDDWADSTTPAATEPVAVAPVTSRATKYQQSLHKHLLYTIGHYSNAHAHQQQSGSSNNELLSPTNLANALAAVSSTVKTDTVSALDSQLPSNSQPADSPTANTTQSALQSSLPRSYTNDELATINRAHRLKQKLDAVHAARARGETVVSDVDDDDGSGQPMRPQSVTSAGMMSPSPANAGDIESIASGDDEANSPTHSDDEVNVVVDDLGSEYDSPPESPLHAPVPMVDVSHIKVPWHCKGNHPHQPRELDRTCYIDCERRWAFVPADKRPTADEMRVLVWKDSLRRREMQHNKREKFRKAERMRRKALAQGEIWDPTQAMADGEAEAALAQTVRQVMAKTKPKQLGGDWLGSYNEHLSVRKRKLMDARSSLEDIMQTSLSPW